MSENGQAACCGPSSLPSSGPPSTSGPLHMQFPLLRKLFPALCQADLQSPLKFRLLLAAPHTPLAGCPVGQSGLPALGRGRFDGFQCPARGARETSWGQGCRTNTRTPIHTQNPSGATKGAPRGSHPPCLQTHLAGGVHTHGPAPAPAHSERAHGHAGAAAHARLATRRPPSQPHAETRAGAWTRSPAPVQTPTRNQAHPARRRGPECPPRSRPRPWGRGAPGAGPATPPGKLRAAGRPPPHPPPPPGPSQRSRARAERGLRGRGRSGARSHGAPDGHPR